MNQMETKAVSSIREVKESLQWIKGFPADDFVNKVSDDFQLFFSTIKAENLMLKIDSAKWKKKSEVSRPIELAVGEMLKFHYNKISERNVFSEEYLNYPISLIFSYVAVPSIFYFESICSILKELVDLEKTKTFLADQRIQLRSNLDDGNSIVLEMLQEVIKLQKSAKNDRIIGKYLDGQIRNSFFHYNFKLYQDQKDFGVIFLKQDMNELRRIPFRILLENYDLTKLQLVTYPLLMQAIYLIFVFKIIEHFQKEEN